MTEPTSGLNLAERLRAETHEAHVQLEAALGFDIHRPDAALAISMLEGFYRVLQLFEPAMLGLLPEHLRDRARLPQLESDLRALGRPLPPAAGNFWLPQTQGEAMGALYVMEGSTLGGKLIAKALRRLPDWPLRGTCYFDPYGSQTGEKWAAFQLELLALPNDSADAVIAGANCTFAALETAMAGEHVS